MVKVDDRLEITIHSQLAGIRENIEAVPDSLPIDSSGSWIRP